jgi:putative transposase
MPRAPRVFVPGAVYHVYNQTSSGEGIFAVTSEAEELIDLLRETKRRDEWTVLAWVIMANHYHVVARAGEVPVWRGLHRVQHVFSRRFNARHDRTGPLWQSRYRAKVVRDEKYLEQVIAYVHLNPVRAGIVGDPARYAFSGHAEIIGKREWGLVDVEHVLLYFGEDHDTALRRYRATLGVAAQALPTREAGRAASAREGWFPRGVPYVDAMGASSAPERPEASPQQWMKAACDALGVSLEGVAGSSRERSTVTARWLMASLGLDHWGLRTSEVSRIAGKLPEVVSRWATQGRRRRAEDPEFRAAYERLDQQLRERFSAGEE